MGRPDTEVWPEFRFGPDEMIGPGLATGPDTGDSEGRLGVDGGPEARLGVENDGPDSWVGPGLVTGPDTGDSEGRLGIDDEPDSWGELVGRPRLS